MRNTVIRRLFSAVLLLVLAIVWVPAGAAKKANTETEIIFSGIPWYTDYASVRSKIEGTKLSSADKNPKLTFGSGDFYAPDWLTHLTGLRYINSGDKDIGGSVIFDTSNAKLSISKNYKISEVELYFMWDLKAGTDGSEAAVNASRFYMARYQLVYPFSNHDNGYNDLVKTFRVSFGMEDYSDVGGPFNNVEYHYWVDKSGAILALSKRDRNMEMVFYAPGADKEIKAVKKAIQ